MISGLFLGYFLYNKKIDTIGKVIAVICAIAWAYAMYKGWVLGWIDG